MNNVYDNKDFFAAYSQMNRSKDGLKGAGEWHALKELFPNLSGLNVLDLGCGYGWHSRYAAVLGAKSVVAIDLSEKMIEKAKEINAGDNISYAVCGLDEFEYEKEAYDFVVSNLVLHYVEDLESVYKNVHKTLKNDGVFLFNIEHPIFTGSTSQDWSYDDKGEKKYWSIDNYFYTGSRKTNFLGCEVTKQHHTLTQIINGLINVGFKVESVIEPMPSEEMLSFPHMKDEMRRPMMLIVKARK